MNAHDDSEVLLRAAARLAHHAGYVAHDLHRWALAPRTTDEANLGLEQDALTRLALCRTPRRGHGFADDVRTLAGFVDAAPAVLASMFREVEAVEALIAAPQSALTGSLLAAARDDGEERTSAALPPRGSPSTPLWLRRCTERFWIGERPPDTYPRDLELPLLLRQPVALVEIPSLRVADVQRWFNERDIAVLEGVADRRLRACLVAYAGVGIILVDSADADSDRRVSLAHEAGHFLLDYLVVRDRVAAHDPALLDVLDGIRTPTSAEQLGALVADVHLGVHTHLFERGHRGGLRNRGAVTAENRAEQVAWELLAPRDEVIRRSAGQRPSQVLESQFGLPADTAKAYGTFLERLMGVSKTDRWLDDLK